MRRSGLLLLGTTIALAACGRLQGPPVELGYRESLVGAGKIVRIENTTSEPLTGIEVEIAAPSGESRTFTLDELGGYETFEIGWKKLGGWQVPAGADVKVRADGFLFPFKGELPADRDDE